jgi:hypothetical protein
VLLVAACVVVALLVLASEYGFHRDELYFIVAGRHPALGYPDQPPFTPLVSAIAVDLLGLSPLAIRIVPAFSAGAIVMLAGLIARSFGGTPRVQVLAAVLTASSGLLAAGHLASTTTFDLLAWAVVLWLVVRLLAGADPRQWMLVGLAAGIGLENKHTMLLLGFGLAVGILAARRWELVRSPWPWLAVGIAILLWAPNLAWQWQHGFPQLEMASRIADRSEGGVTTLATELVLLLGVLTFPVLIAGGWWLLRAPSARSWRPLGWASLAVLAVVILTRGRSYYAVGFLPVLAAAGAVSLDGWLGRGRRRLRAATVAVPVVITALVTSLIALPIVPVRSLGETPIPDIYSEAGAQVGWPELVATVSGVVDELPPEERRNVVILTANYGEAGALELLGKGLPPVVSGHNGYWDWGPPNDQLTRVLLVGPWLGWSWAFRDCTTRAVVHNGSGVPNEEQGAAISVCPSMVRPWSDIWPRLRHLD